ncbi:MAG TPA: hypothetical protein VFA06_07425 [Actinocrinis sp.]|uniref:hypothetical protein n=1 Tax=Actinocrinis sp. TaxID=1920516 RepID=UPI002D40F895|nr:hypothetical protein [Actinocrinis sp.]HZU55682.1 hypothetical protein [Actinocrinis sp.]
MLNAPEGRAQLLVSYAATIFLTIAINRDLSRFARSRRRVSLAVGIAVGVYVATANMFLSERWLSSAAPFAILPLTAAQLLVFVAGLRSHRVAKAETNDAGA